MTKSEIDALLQEGVVVRVAADHDEALKELTGAKAHLLGAEDAALRDPTGAFTLAYDAARKAVVAHMRANGLRVRTRSGAHHQTGRYAQAALAGLVAAEHLSAFVDMREVRNDTEYGAVLVAPSDAAEALAHAIAIVSGIEAAIG